MATVHKAKGMEWDRVYLMSVNNYNYPSARPQDDFISEKWFVRDQLNLQSEALAQVDNSVIRRSNGPLSEKVRPPSMPGGNMPQNACGSCMSALPGPGEILLSPGIRAGLTAHNSRPSLSLPCRHTGRKEAVSLSPDFQFSQGSLQDFVDCPRRFQLRYLLRLAWPAIEAEPPLEHERQLQMGAEFHRLVHQHILGIPVERLSAAAQDEDLRHCWKNYLEFRPQDLPGEHHAEILLSTVVAGHHLLAKYDLIAASPGQKVVIVDWKTSHHRTPQNHLLKRLQSEVYPLVLVQAGAQFNNGRTLTPEQVEMRYWFANFPAQPEILVYDQCRFEADQEHLTSLIEGIKGLASSDFPLTSEEKHCRYCAYRSLCERGVRAGDIKTSWKGNGAGPTPRI